MFGQLVWLESRKTHLQQGYQWTIEVGLTATITKTATPATLPSLASTMSIASWPATTGYNVLYDQDAFIWGYFESPPQHELIVFFFDKNIASIELSCHLLANDEPSHRGARTVSNSSSAILGFMSSISRVTSAIRWHTWAHWAYSLRKPEQV